MSNKVFVETSTYSPVGRMLLHSFPIDEETLEVFPAPYSKSYMVNARGAVPQMIVDAHTYLISAIQLAANPVVKFGPNQEREMKIAVARAYDAIARQEDSEIFQLLNAAVPFDHSLYATPDNMDSRIVDAIRLVEEHDIQVSYVVTHPCQIYRLIDEQAPHFKLSQRRDLHPQKGWFLNIPILSSNQCPKNVIYCVGPSEIVGAIGVQQAVTDVDAADSPIKCVQKPGCLSKVVWEAIAPTVIHDWAVSRVLVESYATSRTPANVPLDFELFKNTMMGAAIKYGANLENHHVIETIFNEYCSAWFKNKKAQEHMADLRGQIDPDDLEELDCIFEIIENTEENEENSFIPIDN